MEYIALGSMSGTSLDGIDLSIIKSNGIDSYEEIDNYFQPYSAELINLIKESITNNYLTNPNLPKLISREYYEAINHIISKNRLINIDVMGIHGQTIFHDGELKISLQVFDKRELKDFSPVMISNFRKNDLLNGGKGAPIIPIFHQLLSNRFNINDCMFVNIGGVTNFTLIKNNSLEASDICFGNALSDDLLSINNSKISYDMNGLFSSKGKFDQDILNLISKDIFFNNQIPKTLDRNYFHKYFSFLKKRSEISIQNSLFSLCYILANEITKYSKQSKIILCGGGRKNNTLLDILKSKNKKVINIDELGVDGDFVESQGIAYLAIRRLLKLPSTFKSTTGIEKEVFLGEIN